MPTLDKLHVGTQAAAHAYLGTNLVWEAEQSPPSGGTLTPAGAALAANQEMNAPLEWQAVTGITVAAGYEGTTISGDRLLMDGAGTITVNARAEFAGATPGVRGLRITHNGAVVYTRESSFDPAQNYIDGTSPDITVQAGDLIGMEVRHHSGNANARRLIGGEGITYFHTTIAGPASAPAQVTGLTTHAGAQSVSLTWPAPDNGGSPITDYAVQHRTAGVGDWVDYADGVSPQPSAQVTPLPEGEHEFRVAAINTAGQGPWSTPATATVAPAGAGTIIWADKFDTAPTGTLATKAAGDAIFAPTAAGTAASTYQHGSIVDDPAGGKFIRHTIPANNQGAFIVSPTPTQQTLHAKLEYESRFNTGFSWAWGGKMGPGLVGWAPGYGPYDPTSGAADRDIGFSTRLMWHGRGASSGTRPFQGTLGPIPAGRDMQVVTYIYARQPNGSAFSGFGYHANIGPELTAGVWFKIAMEVKLNTVGSNDGIFRVWFDDVLAFEATDWNYRMRDDISIMAILWDVHRGGGNTGDWVTPVESQIDVRNVTLTDLT